MTVLRLEFTGLFLDIVDELGNCGVPRDGGADHTENPVVVDSRVYGGKYPLQHFFAALRVANGFVIVDVLGDHFSGPVMLILQPAYRLPCSQGLDQGAAFHLDLAFLAVRDQLTAIVLAQPGIVIKFEFDPTQEQDAHVRVFPDDDLVRTYVEQRVEDDVGEAAVGGFSVVAGHHEGHDGLAAHVHHFMHVAVHIAVRLGAIVREIIMFRPLAI